MKSPYTSFLRIIQTVLHASLAFSWIYPLCENEHDLCPYLNFLYGLWTGLLITQDCWSGRGGEADNLLETAVSLMCLGLENIVRVHWQGYDPDCTTLHSQIATFLFAFSVTLPHAHDVPHTWLCVVLEILPRLPSYSKKKDASLNKVMTGAVIILLPGQFLLACAIQL